MKTININVSQVVAAPLDKVWDVVSDVDNDPKYFEQREREVTVGFQKDKARQTIVLNPKKSVELTITHGPIQGTRITTLSQIDVDRTRIDVSWNFTPSGVPV
jgi:hypothetical protein